MPVRNLAVVRKTLSVAVFILMLLLSALIGACGLLAGTLNFGTVQASTDVADIINVDTTWTKANSPYSLTGPVTVNSGVTLTVEAGVTVNLNDNRIEVDGTLVARGSSADPIYFRWGNGVKGEISFAQSSSNWNEQTDSGCIIENAILSSISLFISSSPKINNNTITGPQAADVIYIYGGSPLISNNNITGDVDSRNVFNIQDGSPVILNNTITAHVDNGLLGIVAPDWDLSHTNRLGQPTEFTLLT
jgi:hypothetical protein